MTQISKECAICDSCKGQFIDYELNPYQERICDILNTQSNLSRLVQFLRSTTDVIRKIQLNWATYRNNALNTANELISNMLLVGHSIEYFQFTLISSDRLERNLFSKTYSTIAKR